MRGPDHVGFRHIAPAALGGALLVSVLPGAAAVAADTPASLPRCVELGPGSSDDGELATPWQTLLDEEGAVTGHRLTLRKGDAEVQLRTGRRGFRVRLGSQRMLIGERADGETRLDMIDTARACRVWSRRHGRLLYPERDEASAVLRMTAHERDSRRYEGTHLLDPQSGQTQAVLEEPCLEQCLPSDGPIGPAALQVATTVRPTPNFAAGGWPKDKKLTFRWRSNSVPPTWAWSPLRAGADDATRSSRSRSPKFVYSSSGANAVSYSATLASFCSSAAIACAGRGMPTYWGVWIRPYGTDFSWGTLRWCQKTSSASGCFDLRRVMLHELGHIVGLDHPSNKGYKLAAGDSVMQGITPARPQPGASRHDFGRCDVATLQELYDTPNNKTRISTCNDVATKLSLAASRWTISKGASVKLTATLKVANLGAYRELAGNPLNGRSLKLKYRRAGSNDTWKTAWMRSTYRQGRYEVTLSPGATWEFKAVFSKPGNEGLRYSRSEIRKVKVNG